MGLLGMSWGQKEFNFWTKVVLFEFLRSSNFHLPFGQWPLMESTDQTTLWMGQCYPLHTLGPDRSRMFITSTKGWSKLMQILKFCTNSLNCFGLKRNGVLNVFIDCSCTRAGTVNGSATCDQFTGQCVCKPTLTGRTCDSCKVGQPSFCLTKCWFRDRMVDFFMGFCVWCVCVHACVCGVFVCLHMCTVYACIHTRGSLGRVTEINSRVSYSIQRIH